SKRKCMEVGKRWSSARRRGAAGLTSLLAFVAGCATVPAPLDEALRVDTKRAGHGPRGNVEAYVVGCPDVLEIRINGYPERNARVTVGPDGWVDIPDCVRLRAEGASLLEIGQIIAERLHLPPAWLDVRIAKY